MTQPPALAAYLTALGDDELILAHRNSEWTGHGPILEEDIAFTNIALDEMGHANLWYSLVQTLTGRDPDELAFFRDAPDYRNVQFVELPRGDWAFSMLRQYLFDAAEAVRLPALTQSRYAPLAEAAAKIRTEEIYHYRHTQAWARRLGLGTDESHRRMQTALDAMWPYALQLFAAQPGEAELVAAGLVPAPTALQQGWLELVVAHLSGSGLSVPQLRRAAATARDEHSEHLAGLLEEMQGVARMEREGTEW